MGEVYLARDTKLDRQVAIKVLPETMTQDKERVARFEREAKLLASLNHPNIATIHGFDDSGGTRFLVMEYVEGETLGSHLKKGPVAVEDALDIAKQIAEALEAAHGQGVIHRDLKPANVMIRSDGTIKVLDFGLAKAMADEPSGAADANSPTITVNYTRPGVVLGTAAYMSPEQARGRALDKRTDIWSFGIMLFECLAGERLFQGETANDSMGAIMHKDPDWSLLPSSTPPTIQLLLRRCLTKDRKHRLHDIADARIELENAIADPTASSLGLAGAALRAERVTGVHGVVTRVLPWVLMIAAVLVAGWFAMRGGPPPSSASRRLMIPVPGVTEYGDLAAAPPAISPDGRFIVFGVEAPSGETRLWIRPLNDFTARSLDGTDGAAYAFWSPDSRHVAFFRRGRLRRIEIATGREQAIGGEASSSPRGGSWNARGQIVFAPNANTGIHVINAAGGEARQITDPDPEIPDGSHRWPWFLPDGERFLFTVWTNDLDAQEKFGGVYLGSLSGDQEPRRLLSDPSSAIYASPSHLLVMRGDNLVAIPFDTREGKIEGEAAVIASGVLYNRATGYGAFSASNDHTLVYAGGQAFLPSTLTWYDRDGNRTAVPVESAAFFNFRLAPDASRAAAEIPGPTGDGEVWIIDLARGVRTRLIHSASENSDPVWSGDGSQILYATQDRGVEDLFVRFADGSGTMEPMLVDDMDMVLYDWSPDGRYIAYWPLGSGSGTPDIWIYSVERETTEPLIAGEPTYEDARFSPDVRWVTYVSDDSGRREVFVQAFGEDAGARAGARSQVSTEGGERPHWRDDGLEIVYIDPERRLMAVDVEENDGKLSLGTPRELFTFDDPVQAGDATGDHLRFLVATREEAQSEPLYVILNWPADH